MPERGQQISIIAQENLMIAAYLFHHRWKCSFDWEVTGVEEDTMPKVDKAFKGGMMEATEEYLRSCHSVIRASLVYIIRKTVIVQTYGDYSKYVTFDDEMIARMLHVPSDKSKLI